MKTVFPVILLLGAAQQALGGVDAVSQAELERAWLAFTNARGEASLILGDVEHPSANDVFRVIPDVGADSLDEAKLQLGFDLFHDTRLSKDGSLACATCHITMLGGVDRRPVSFGIGGAQGTLNAPTIFNAALNFRQFWDGRALTLQEQALGPIENPVELGHDLQSVVAMLNSIPDYATTFDALYPDGVTAANLGDALAYYETMNFTGLSSPFLQQFEDDHEPLSRQARRGQQRFVEVGCASCHNGVNLGGNSYQQLGVAEPWYNADRPASDADIGLAGRTGRAQDRHVFKVPSLHNVAATGPWLHDGSVTSLQQAVDRMARHQLGRYLESDDIDDIVAFLRSLGDSLGLVGDCAVSGSYTVTMDCSVRQRSAVGSQEPSADLIDVFGNMETLAQHHHSEYEIALVRVADAPARIEKEMQRISAGTVAHYDFLQFEHIEMLRHARALSFPPANIDVDQREALLLQAARLQQSAQDLELTIASFLRTQAVASSAMYNYQDLLQILAKEADEKVISLLANAEQSLLAYYAQPDNETKQRLQAATLALLDEDLSAQHLEELQVQVRLLLQ